MFFISEENLWQDRLINDVFFVDKIAENVNFTWL